MPASNDTNVLMDPWGAHYFSLEIGNSSDPIAHFQECTGLKTTTEVFEIEEGGNIGHTHKRPGYAKWENIILKRGVSKGAKFVHWRDEYMFVPNTGWDRREMSSGAIVVRALDGTELRRYSFNQAWPVSWEGPQFASGGSDLAIETLEIAHEGLVVKDKARARREGAAGGASGGRAEGPGGAPPPSSSSSSQLDANEGPRFTAGLFGHDLTQADPMGGEELIVEEHVDMISSMRARINAGSFPWGDVKIGDAATAAFGGHADITFTGIVTSIRHFSKMGIELVEVTALDPQILLASSRHTKLWEDEKDSDIANVVIQDGGATAGTIDQSSATHKYVFQRNESNLAFLKRLAARNGYLLLANHEGKIDFKKPQFSGSALELPRGEVISLDYTVSHQEVPPSVTVYGWDYIAKEKVEGKASSGDLDKIGGGTDAVSDAGTIWADDLYITDVWVSDAGAAKDMATAELNRYARSFVRGRGVIAGTGTIRAGVKIKFKDYATGFNPEGVVVGTRHRIQGGTYTSEFYFESNTKPQ